MSGFHLRNIMPRIGRCSFWACLIAVLLLALLPGNTKLLPTTGWDKANHALAFATLGLLANIAYPRRIASTVFGLLVFGGLIEILQSFTPTRSAEWADLLADAVGLALAAGLMGVISRVDRRVREI